MIAIILIKTVVGKAFEASEKIRQIKGVVNVHTVTGPYDVIAIADSEHTSLRSLVASIHNISGVQRTETCLTVT